MVMAGLIIHVTTIIIIGHGDLLGEVGMIRIGDHHSVGAGVLPGVYPGDPLGAGDLPGVGIAPAGDDLLTLLPIIITVRPEIARYVPAQGGLLPLVPVAIMPDTIAPVVPLMV